VIQRLCCRRCARGLAIEAPLPQHLPAGGCPGARNRHCHGRAFSARSRATALDDLALGEHGTGFCLGVAGSPRGDHRCCVRIAWMCCRWSPRTLKLLRVSVWHRCRPLSAGPPAARDLRTASAGSPCSLNSFGCDAR
jgi:hypothetical protein